jgi:hypothetical protein
MKKDMKFPPCNHYFCIDCCKKIIYWDAKEYHLSPEFYGCPECPNNCNNPKRGAQCYCDDYIEIQKEWSKDNPQFIKWVEDESSLIKEYYENTIYGNQKCPLCRKNI